MSSMSSPLALGSSVCMVGHDCVTRAHLTPLVSVTTKQASELVKRGKEHLQLGEPCDLASMVAAMLSS